MPRWIEIPARRVFEVERQTFRQDFDVFGEDGQPIGDYDRPYRIVKKSNGRVFKPAEFIPAGPGALESYYLEEI